MSAAMSTIYSVSWIPCKDFNINVLLAPCSRRAAIPGLRAWIPLRGIPGPPMLWPLCLLFLPAMRVDELSFNLPPELIAQRPLDRRDASRLLLLDRLAGDFEDSSFSFLPTLLRGDELLVFNNARVLPARLFGHSLDTRSQKKSSESAPQ